MFRIKLLGVNKSGRCNVCERRYGSKGQRLVVRFTVPDEYRGILAASICKRCLLKWLYLLS
jgi:hypothetical protein